MWYEAFKFITNNEIMINDEEYQTGNQDQTSVPRRSKRTPKPNPKYYNSDFLIP